jgi:acetyl esterase/lipase
MTTSACPGSRRARGLSFPKYVLTLLVTVPLVAAQEARVERDVIYRTGGGPDQTLDLYVPAASGFPTVIFVHGGSLRESGERRSSELYARVCEPFVAAGVGCATIDYRLAPTHRWPAMPEDVAAAVRWVHDNIGARGGDPRRLFLFGHSSGCHLAAAVGTNPKYLESVGLTPGDLAGIIPMGCILAPLDPIIRHAQAQGFGLDSLRSRWNAHPDDRFASFEDRLDSDPSRFVGGHVPPALIVIAERERFRPPILEQAAHFVDLMYEARRPADIVIVPGSHMSSIADIVNPDDPTFTAILRFIENPDAAGLGSRPSSIR